MASSNQITQWTQQKQVSDAQKKLAAKLKVEGANMLKDIYEAILHLKDFIAKLLDAMPSESESADSTKIVLREDCQPLLYFCQCLERVLLFGYKKKFFRSASLWSFVCDAAAKCLPQCQQLATDFNLIQSIESLNDNGKMRAFLRQSLRSRLIPLYFKLILEQNEVIQLSRCVGCDVMDSMQCLISSHMLSLTVFSDMFTSHAMLHLVVLLRF